MTDVKSALNKIKAKTASASAKPVDQYLKKYMQQVYNYMTVGLLVTAFFGYLIVNTPLKDVFFTENVTNEGGTFIALSFFGFLAVISPLILVFIINPILASKRLKAGLFVFLLFSALMGVSLASVLLTYTGVSITRIFVASAAMFIGMSLYGSITGKDLTSWGSFLLMGLIGVIISAIINIFLQSPALYYTSTIIGIFIFLGLTAFDTQRIKSAYLASDGLSLMHSKAIMGALSLYLDFINLFFMLLSLFGDRR